jgi:V/A-type H+-transporting ATPase subunit I
MNAEMIPVEILGLKSDLQTVTRTLRDLGCVHIDDISNSPQVLARQLALDRDIINRQEELSFLLARTDGLLKTLDIHFDLSAASQDGENITKIRSGLDQLLPQVQSLTAKREELQGKLALLPRYEATLRKLLPIIPSSAHAPGNVSIGVLVSRVHVAVLDSVSKRILDLTAGQAEMVASDIDASTRGMFIVFPSEYRTEIEAMLGREDVTRLRLPAELSEGNPDVILQALHRQLISLPPEIERINQELAGLASTWSQRLIAWREALSDELLSNSVLSRFGETETAFVITGWIPSREIDRVETSLGEAVGDAFLLSQLPLTPQLNKRAPILMQNPRPATPFSLVGLRHTTLRTY